MPRLTVAVAHRPKHRLWTTCPLLAVDVGPSARVDSCHGTAKPSSPPRRGCWPVREGEPIMPAPTEGPRLVAVGACASAWKGQSARSVAASPRVATRPFRVIVHMLRPVSQDGPAHCPMRLLFGPPRRPLPSISGSHLKRQHFKTPRTPARRSSSTGAAAPRSAAEKHRPSDAGCCVSTGQRGLRRPS
jgi:hypothetical protein